MKIKWIILLMISLNINLFGDGLTSLSGGLYYGYGGGYKIDDKLAIEAVYKHNFGKYHSYILFLGDSDYDLEYSRLNLSLIYTY